MTAAARYWVAGYQSALIELADMGMPVSEARAILQAARSGQTVDIGEGQHVRKADEPGRYAISRMGA